jgi:predicted N-formylglutamate amidohydrolase
MPDARSRHEPVEVFVGGSARSRVLITCEHASNHVPTPFGWTEEDEWLAQTHWAYDVGAAILTRELATQLEAVAVLAGFSRLLADPNRPETSPELFRARAEGRRVQMNHDLDDAERERRLELFWRPFHDAAHRTAANHPGDVVFAVHSFTPSYEGTPRAMELGVLFDEEEALAVRLAERLRRAGFVVAMNEPYSGKEGLLYSAERHARAHARRAVEIEVRQDLIVDERVRQRICDALERELSG